MIEQFIHIDSNGSKFYYKDQTVKTFHRVDGPAVERSSGTKYWWVDGNLHRVDGPAVEYADGSKCWYLDGKLHRVDGPAVEYADGSKYWWVDGVNFSQAKFNATVNPHKASCEGKTVVVDGVTYQLTKV